MQLKELMYVVKVAQTRHFSKAAQQLYVSQPTLSKAIQKLENELGVQLFTRNRGNIQLTSVGEIFLEDAGLVLQLLENMKKKLEDVHELKRGKVRIGISQVYGKYYFAKIMSTFTQMYPDIELNIVEEISSKLEELLLNGELDFSIFSLPIISPQLSYQVLFEEDIFFAIAPNHPLSKKFKAGTEIDLKLFKEEKFIMIKAGQRMHDICLNYCQKADFIPQVTFETRSSETANILIAKGMGVGFVSSSVANACKIEDRAIYFKLKNIATTRSFVAAYIDNGYLSKAATAFLQVAKEFGSPY